MGISDMILIYLKEHWISVMNNVKLIILNY